MTPTFHVEKLKTAIESSLDDGKAFDIVSIDLAGKSDIADYMIIASGTSQPHLTTLAQRITERLEAVGLGPLWLEGEGCDWVVVDAGDIVIHLFHPETRRYYGLEKMWGDMPALEAVV